MAARMIVTEAFNLFAGDGVDEEGKHLTITNMSLPSFKDMTADHKAGGAVGALSVGGLGLEALEISFKLAGYDPQTKAQMDGGGGMQRFTMYGAMRDKQDGTLRELKVVVLGRLQEMTPAEMSRGDLGDQDHKVGEITHYEEYLDGKEVYFYDWSTVAFRTGGVDQWAARRTILRI